MFYLQRIFYLDQKTVSMIIVYQNHRLHILELEKRNLKLTLKLADKTQDTSIKKKTLLPVWNESFNFSFKSSKTYKLVLEVSLWDIHKKSKDKIEFLGKMEYLLIEHSQARSKYDEYDDDIQIEERVREHFRTSTLLDLPMESYLKQSTPADTSEVSKQDLLYGYSPCWFDLEPQFSDEPRPGRICLGISILDLGEYVKIQKTRTDDELDSTIMSTVCNLPIEHNIFADKKQYSVPTSLSSPSMVSIGSSISASNDVIVEAPLRKKSIFGDHSMKGIIKLDISKCLDLPDGKKNGSFHWIGNLVKSFSIDRKSKHNNNLQSPFITVGFSKLTYKTRVIRRSNQPEWNDKMIFPIRNTEGNYLITFSLYNYRKLGHNALLATASLKASLLCDNPEEYQKIIINWNYIKPVPLNYNPVLIIHAGFIPSKTLRYNFWNTLSKMYDHDENGKLNSMELLTMLESLGCSFTEPIIRIIFDPLKAVHLASDKQNETNNAEIEISMEELVPQLEELIHISTERSRRKRESRRLLNLGSDDPSNMLGRKFSISMPDLQQDGIASISARENESPTSSNDGSYEESIKGSFISSLSISESSVSEYDNETLQYRVDGDEQKSQGADQMQEFIQETHCDNIVCLRECPVCHKPWRRKNLGDEDIITHLAICVSEDISSISQFVMGGFLTEEYASRKWYTRIIAYLGYGGYRLGKRNGNIFVRDRYSGRLIEEKIPTYIRLGLRLVYQSLGSNKTVETKMARQLLQYMTVKEGKKFNDPSSVKFIRQFVNYFKINLDEVLLSISQFKTFNDFFYRKLKPDARPLASSDPLVATSPADCRITVFQSISEATRLWIKGTNFSIANLLKDQSMARYFDGGSLLVCRLAPQDYHRFHCPVDGIMEIIIRIPGAYYTVNPMAVRQNLDVFTENSRVVSYIYSDHFGKVAYIAIGAMMVGSIEYTCKEGQRMSRGDEIGYFAFGGSTIVLVFSKDVITLNEDLIANSGEQLETWIRCGDSIGCRKLPSSNIVGRSSLHLSPTYAASTEKGFTGGSETALVP